MSDVNPIFDDILDTFRGKDIPSEVAVHVGMFEVSILREGFDQLDPEGWVDVTPTEWQLKTAVLHVLDRDDIRKMVEDAVCKLVKGEQL